MGCGEVYGPNLSIGAFGGIYGEALMKLLDLNEKNVGDGVVGLTNEGRSRRGRTN